MADSADLPDAAPAGGSPAPAPARPPPWTGGGIGSDAILRFAVLLVLVAGAWRVIEPFLPAILFSMAIASCAWPAYKRLRRGVRGRDALAAVIACVAVLACVLVPAMLLILGLADGARTLLDVMDERSTLVLPALPAGVRALPLIGADVAQAWEALRQDPGAVQRLLGYGVGPARDVALVTGRALANAAMQVGISSLLLYFFFRHGERLAQVLGVITSRLCGGLARELVEVARSSVAGVMFGEIGAGIAQGAVATVGFLLAGVPNPFLLGALTFVVSIIPVGPPLIWFGAALWLLHQGQAGWAMFMVLYGMLCISAIDNVIKPLLISRASRMPFVFALVGVFGGVLGFGVVGVFLGPTLLALVADLASHWIGSGPAAAPEE